MTGLLKEDGPGNGEIVGGPGLVDAAALTGSVGDAEDVLVKVDVNEFDVADPGATEGSADELVVVEVEGEESENDAELEGILVKIRGDIERGGVEVENDVEVEDDVEVGDGNEFENDVEIEDDVGAEVLIVKGP